MKTLIIYVSVHHGNTKKIAKVMAEIFKAEVIKPNKVDIKSISEYDLIGFGSGIYAGKHHKSLLNLVDKLPELKKEKIFIFSTRGVSFVCFFHRLLKKKLLRKGVDIVGEFSCRGYNTFGPFKLIGGISKGRPNEIDLENARNFAKNLYKKMLLLM